MPRPSNTGKFKGRQKSKLDKSTPKKLIWRKLIFFIPRIIDSLKEPDSDKVVTECYGNVTAEKPDLVLISPHDGDAEMFLKRYPEIAAQFEKEPRVFTDYLDLERDIGATRIARATAVALSEISEGRLRTDVVNVAEIPRGVIDTNRAPDQDPDRVLFDLSAVPPINNARAIRDIFNENEHPNLVREFNRLHLAVIAYISASIDRLADSGLFMEIHTMRDYGTRPEVTLTPEGPSLEALKAYIEQFTNPSCFGRQRQANLVTSFPGQSPIVHMGLLRSLEAEFAGQGIDTERDHPYCFLPHIMSARNASSKPGRNGNMDLPIRLISKDGKAHNIWPEIDPAKVAQIGRLNAQAIYSIYKDQHPDAFAQAA